MYKAKFPYEADSKTDICLDVGDIIYHVEDVGNGWSLGYNKNRGTTGTFPTSYVVKRTSSILKSLSIRTKTIDKIALTAELFEKPEDVVPRIKAKIPADVLHRRLTQASGQHRIFKIKLPEFVNKTVKKLNETLFQSKRDEHTFVKGIFGVFGGILACFVLFLLLRFGYDYTFSQSGYITFAASIPICAAFSVSTHIRCILLLMVPSLFTGNGRTVFMTIIFALLLNGPVMNIAFNANQASESMACTQELIYNQTLILKRQLEAPIKKIEREIYDGLVKLKSVAGIMAKDIKRAMSFFTQVSNKLNEAKNGLKKIAQECSSRIKTAHTSCENDIKAVKTNCEKHLRAIDPTRHLIDFGQKIDKSFRTAFGKKRKKRWVTNEKTAINLMGGNKIEQQPRTVATGSKKKQTGTDKHVLHRYKRAGFLDSLCVFVDVGEICKIVHVGEFGCFILDSISGGLADISISVTSPLNDTLNFFYFEFDGNIDISDNFNSSKTASQIIKEVKADIESKTRDFLTAGTVVTYILSLTLLFLFLKSVFYLKKFQCDDSYDNFYITKSFKLYDQNCKATGSTSALPLKAKERKKYVDTRSFSLSSKEVAKSKRGLIKVSIHLLIATSIICFDYILYFILQIIDRYGNLNVRIGGTTNLDISVDGSGLIHQFLELFISQIQIESKFDTDFNLTTCIPNPKKPDEKNVFIFSFLYFFAFVFVLMQAYGFRLRRKIATYFYPERDSKRIIYLHEKIRNNRKMFFGWLKQHLISNRKQQYMENRISFRGWLEYRHPQVPKYFFWCFPKTRMCTCCSTNLNSGDKSHRCDTCQSEYCDDCYGDMNYNCLVCSARTDFRLRF